MGKYTQLTVTDRRRLHAYLSMGLKINEIAIKLRRHKSTVYREVKRNSELEGYYPVRAQEKKQTRNRQKYSNKIERDSVLREWWILCELNARPAG